MGCGSNYALNLRLAAADVRRRRAVAGGPAVARPGAGVRPSAPLYDALAADYDAHFAVPHRRAYDELAWEVCAAAGRAGRRRASSTSAAGWAAGRRGWWPRGTG